MGETIFKVEPNATAVRFSAARLPVWYTVGKQELVMAAKAATYDKLQRERSY